MSLNDASVEPRKIFLNNLVNLYFQTAISLIEFSNYTQGVKAMRTLMLIIPPTPKERVAVLREKAKSFMLNDCSPEDMYALFEEIGAFLNDHYFQELQLGIIPTSTLEGQKPKPEQTPIKPEASSRL